MPGAKQINDLNHVVTRMMGARPSSNQTTLTMPFGTAIKQPKAGILLAFTVDGISEAKVDTDQNLILGQGIAREYYLAYDPYTNTTTTKSADTNDITVFNLATTATASSIWIVCERICGLCVVMWEQCPTT